MNVKKIICHAPQSVHLHSAVTSYVSCSLTMLYLVHTIHLSYPPTLVSFLRPLHQSGVVHAVRVSILARASLPAKNQLVTDKHILVAEKIPPPVNSPAPDNPN